MAMEERTPGKTLFGQSGLGRPRGGVGANSPLGDVSYLCLVDTSGNERFLWFDTSGNLRTSTTIPANPNTGGTVVGP